MKKLIVLIFVMISITVYSANLNVNLSKTYQTMEGFGGGIVYYQNWLTSHENREEIYDTLFTGLNIQLLRIGNWAQDLSKDLSADSTIVYNAKKRLGNNFRILMSSWSAPAELKASGDVKGSGHNKTDNTLKKENGRYVYEKFAHWWKQSLLLYREKGIDPYFISMQNEPDMNADYEETLFEPTETSDYAGYKEALSIFSDSIRTVNNPPKIAGPEVLGIGYGNFDKYASKLDKSKFDVYNYHLYHGGTYDSPDDFVSTMSVIGNDYSDKPNIMTEYCPLRTPQEGDMIASANIIIHDLVDANASGYIAWELMWGGHSQMVAVENPWDKSQWTTSNGYTINPEYHTIRHFSKFIERGWKRVDITSSDDNLRVVAFANIEKDNVTIVVVNISSNSINSNINIDSKYSLKKCIQSVENGEKSRLVDVQSNQSDFNFPAKSITTLVYGNSTAINSKQIVKNKLLVFPAPVLDKILVYTNLQGKIVLYNSNQKVVKYLNKGVNLVPNLPKGVYSVVVEKNGKVLEYKKIYKTELFD